MALTFSPSAFLETAKSLKDDLRHAVNRSEFKALLQDWWDDEVWHFFEPPWFRYQLTVRDINISKQAGCYPKDLMEDERYVCEDPREWLASNAKGPYQVRVSGSGNIYFVKFARKSDMAKFILLMCDVGTAAI